MTKAKLILLSAVCMLMAASCSNSNDNKKSNSCGGSTCAIKDLSYIDNQVKSLQFKH